MNLQNLNPSFQIRLVNDDTAVKSARTEQCLIQHLRTVGRSQNQNSLGGIKTIHLGQQLIQRLFPLIIAAVAAGIPALSDGINLIDEDDARRILLRLVEQVADTGRADTDEHLHKIRSSQREERHLRLPGNRLCQKRLSGSGRTDQESALRQLCTDLRIPFRMLQEIDCFLQGFLGLILAGDILEGHTGLVLHVHLGAALADAHHAGAAVHPAKQDTHQDPDQNQRRK